MAFLRECFRVLKNEGIIRVVVPDLEKIARLYLMALEGSCAGSTQWHRNYEWMLLEMYDQAVRERGDVICRALQERSWALPKLDSASAVLLCEIISTKLPRFAFWSGD